MTMEDAGAELAAECPRKILGVLHTRGLYRHVRHKDYGGRVACLHKGTPAPEGCEPTGAQAALDLLRGAEQ